MSATPENSQSLINEVLAKIEWVRQVRKQKFYLRDQHITLSHGRGGKADGVFINTAGVGLVAANWPIGQSQARPGDKILLNGPVGDHGIAILLAREALELETEIESDTAPLHELVARLLSVAGSGTHCLKDPTPGGVATRKGSPTGLKSSWAGL